MSLTSALLSANSGLRVSQNSLDIVSRNIANANTEGYTKKSSRQSVQFLQGQASGVLSEPIQRFINADLQRQFRNQSSNYESLSVKDSFLSNLEALFGRPEDATNIASQYNNFENSFLALKTTPESAIAQDTVLTDAANLTRSLNNMAGEVTEMRNNAERQIADEVTAINDITASLHELNVQIVRITSGGNETAPDLEDKRDTLLNQLSAKIDISTYKDDKGRIFVNVGNGQELLGTKANSITFTAQTINANSKYTSPQTYPTSAPALGGLEINGQDIAAGLKGGKVAGLFELRDEILPQAQAQLDEFSGTLIKSFEAADIILFTDPSNPAPHPHPSAETVGLASRIEVSKTIISEPWRLRDGSTAISESSSGADTTIIDAAISNVFEGNQTFRTSALGGGASPDIDSELSGSATFKDYISSFVSFQASQKAQTSSRLSFETTISTSLSDRIDSESGVNVDEEMLDLIKLENAYSASAKAIQSIQRMLDDLLNIV